MNPEQLKAALRSAGYLVMSEGGGGYGTEPGDPWVDAPVTYYYFGPRGRASATEAAAAIGVPEATLASMESRMAATPEESSSLYPSRGGGGFFGGFFEQLQGLVTSPSFALAASVIAPSILAAEAAGAAAAAAAPAAAPAANTGAGLIDASLGQAYSNLGVGAAAPAAGAGVLTQPIATSPLAPIGNLGNVGIDASLGQAYSNLGVGANALAPSAGINALAPVFDPASALETQLTTTSPAATAAAAATGAATNPSVFDPASAAETQLTATPGTTIPPVFDPASAAETQLTATPSTTNALAPTFDPASAAETQLTATPGVTGLPPGALDTLAKFAKDYGVPLSALISGITGSQAAQSAADTQAQSAREARDLAKQIYEKQVSLQEPFRTAGITAQNQLLTLLGLQGGTQGAEFGRYARPFGMQDFQADPGYAFRLSEGMKALEASRAAKGGLLSGATGKALQRYGQDLGSQEYGNAFNRYQTERVNRLQPLGALMGTGQAAASNQGAAAGQYGTTAGGLTTDIGAVTAGGQLGAARAISNALSAYGNYLGNQNLAQAIRESQYIR